MKADPETIHKRHIVDVTRAHAAFREAPARTAKSITSTKTYLEPWTSTWNGRSYAGKWHVVTLQEAIEYLEHDFLTNRFHVTLWRLFGLVQQGYLLFGHRRLVNVPPRHQGLRTGQDKRRRIWVGVTRCRFKSSFSSATAQWPKILHNACLCTSTTTTPKSVESGRSFSSLSAPLCRQSTWTWSPVTSTELPGANQMVTTPQPTSIPEEAFADTDFPLLPGPTPLWGPGAVPSERTDVCGFVKLPNSYDKWKVRLHGAFTLPGETLGLRPRDQSCHHEVWLHLDLVGNQYAHEPRGNHEQRVLLQERSCPYPSYKEKMYRPVDRWNGRFCLCLKFR